MLHTGAPATAAQRGAALSIPFGMLLGGTGVGTVVEEETFQFLLGCYHVSIFPFDG